MAGVLYIGCTPVTRYLLLTHLQHFGAEGEIPIAGIVNLNRSRSVNKANYDSLYDFYSVHGLPLHYCDNVNDQVSMDWMAERDPTLIIQSGWSQKFRPALLDLPRFGCIGEHPAPLPRGRGAACVNWAILTGESDWGDSFFRMVEQYDAGPVYAQEKFQIEPHDTVKTVYDKVAWTASKMLQQHLSEWRRGNFQPLTLDESKATYFKRRRPEDGRIDLGWEAQKLQNYVRALTRPYPGAFFEIGDRKTLIWEAQLTSMRTRLPAGTFMGASESGGVDVAVGGGAVWRIQALQIEGLPEMTGAQFYDRFVGGDGTPRL